MKLRSTIFPAVLSLLFLGFSACSGDDDSPEDVNIGCADFMEEWQVAVTAISAYNQNPTTENCEAYRTAVLEFYEEYSDCERWGEDYQDDLEEIQQLDCSEVEAET